MRDRLLMVIFPSCPPIARNRSSGETAIEHMSGGCWLRPSWVCVVVSQNVTVRFVEYAMNFPCFSRAMDEKSVLSGIGHSETADPVDASICFNLLSDITKRWLLNQRRPVLNNGVTLTLMSTSKRPSLLSQTRTESGVAVAIRSPRGEYLAALSEPTWPSVCTRLRVAMSQMVVVPFSDAKTSRDESGDKSTPLILPLSLCEKTFSYVLASHTNTSPRNVPAAIHLPSLDTARHMTLSASIFAICLPSSTRHTRTPMLSPVKRYSPLAENVTADTRLPTSISVAGFNDQSINARCILSVRTGHY